MNFVEEFLRLNLVILSGRKDRRILALFRPPVSTFPRNQKSQTKSVYKNCAEVFKSGDKIRDVYKIDPDGLGEIEVFCDHETAGGGWMVFQKRFDGTEDFFRTWDDYKRGFGNVKGEFWLGLDKIHRLTASSNKLRVDLGDFHGKTAFAEHSSFSVASEYAKYRLSLGSYSGTAGDSLGVHDGSAFSTKDRDNDAISGGNCAFWHKGAWWYKSCHVSNLNGMYLDGRCTYGVCWYDWKRRYESLKRSEMKIRPKEF
ncbi:ryncolin-1-like [Stylophora pistillata]|uniref:ryncolin-1-like n=1 Tax=Stylophora pistillata TaxID=50429 RepID=UPI000C03F7D1|nr:ryncolin-1-like [Stylophora pistillata]